MDKPSLREILREQIEALRTQEERARQERVILERTLGDLQSLDLSSPIITEQRKLIRVSAETPSEGHNKAIIATILREKGTPLRIAEIASYAMEKGLIQSTKGMEGVYSIVQTVLSRNSKTMFIKLDRGVWDLRERHVKNLDEAESQPVSLSPEKKEVDILNGQTESHVISLSPNDAIIFVLENSTIPLTPKEIRAYLNLRGYPEEKWGKDGAYFYAVLKRLADRGTICKVGEGYSMSRNGHTHAKQGHIWNDMGLREQEQNDR